MPTELLNKEVIEQISNKLFSALVRNDQPHLPGVPTAGTVWLPSLDEFRNFLLTNGTDPIIQEFALTRV